MYKVLNFLAVVFCLFLHQAQSRAQRTNEEFHFQMELAQTMQLIVMISVEYDGDNSGVGAGIIFANEKDRLLIATASHVIQKGATPAQNIFIRFRSAPDKLIKATVLKQINTGEDMDLAVLSVSNLAAHGINPCAVPFDRLSRQDDLERKDEVMPIGNPNGRAWSVPVDADKISDVTDSEIVFQSNNIKSGHSGGALIDSKANLIGMVTADEAPLGHAMRLAVLVKQLKQWKFPVMLSRTLFREERYDPPLHIAADSGNISELKKLLDDCHNPNGVDFHYRTPLHYAASNGNMQALSLLLKAGAMIDVQDFNEMYPLSLAISGNHLEAVKLLTKGGAKLNSKSFGGSTALHGALEKNINPQIPIYLIQAGANVNAEDDEKDTPLHYAVNIGNIDVVKALLKAGADPDAENSRRMNPLMIAVVKDDVKMIETLVSSGASIKIPKSSKVYSALHAAASHANNPETLKQLLKAGADVNGIDEVRNTPLHYAILRAMSNKPEANNAMEFIKILLGAGADPNIMNDEKKTPLANAKDSLDEDDAQSVEIRNRIITIENMLTKYRVK